MNVLKICPVIINYIGKWYIQRLNKKWEFERYLLAIKVDFFEEKVNLLHKLILLKGDIISFSEVLDYKFKDPCAIKYHFNNLKFRKSKIQLDLSFFSKKRLIDSHFHQRRIELILKFSEPLHKALKSIIKIISYYNEDGSLLENKKLEFEKTKDELEKIISQLGSESELNSIMSSFSPIELYKSIFGSE